MLNLTIGLVAAVHAPFSIEPSSQGTGIIEAASFFVYACAYTGKADASFSCYILPFLRSQHAKLHKD
jgi:hypothetical protein